MTFNGKQLAALVKMGVSMALADGRLADEERITIVMELASFGVTEDQAAGLLDAAQSMEASEALSVLSNMTQEQKKYATGYMAVVMAADGNIADDEVKLWQLVSTLCSFPTMSIREAYDFWKQN